MMRRVMAVINYFAELPWRTILRRSPQCLLAAILLLTGRPAAQNAPHPTDLTISGEVAKSLSLSLADLSAIPHKTLKVTNSHDHNEEVYEGVPLAVLLKLAGATQGDQLRGAAMATCVVIEAADGYRVVFSLAELDPGTQDSNVLVADKLDGRALSDQLGPLRIVAPLDKRPARWVRMVRAIRVTTVPK
jgi:DMSO/TMAO reductase YedYZ molybdopterin-dependent catalytic subunit